MDLVRRVHRRKRRPAGRETQRIDGGFGKLDRDRQQVNQLERGRHGHPGCGRGQAFPPQRVVIPLNPPEQWYAQLPPPWNQAPAPESNQVYQQTVVL